MDLSWSLTRLGLLPQRSKISNALLYPFTKVGTTYRLEKRGNGIVMAQYFCSTKEAVFANLSDQPIGD